MATTFYFRNSNIGLGVYNDLLTRERGALATSLSGNTVSGGTWVSIGYWAVQPLVGFTLAGSVSCNLRASESNAQANASIGMRIYKYSNGTLSGSLGQASGITELTTSETATVRSVTPTSTVFANGDMLVVEIGAINIGTMGAGRSVSFFFNGPTAAASGDSYFTITENVLYKNRTRLTE